MLPLASWILEYNSRAIVSVSYNRALAACMAGAVPGAERRGSRWFAPINAIPAAAAWIDAQPRNRRSAGVIARAAA